MRLLHADGREVVTGDIVWMGGRSHVFLQHNDRLVEVQTTDDRRMFMWVYPSDLNLTLEANHEEKI